ncbi:thiamine pyrophosphate-dependent enzyme [Candidatus Pelagibacter sp.]|jgi:transketolase|nr:thiamine pyrophosphate-dependent enzyme [Candidatus Pelagibacter sp.]|tara:strand:+ start:313 stop:1080 length:768 start_codon:yes stop_codon:yes gene_type:complete
MINSKERCKIIRNKILDLSQKVPALHIGGAFSSVELIERIFFQYMRSKDTFILSKGHAGILLYVVLNLKGKISDKELNLYCKKEGKLGVHPDFGTFGINASTGSLGHGLSLAAGMALAEKNKKKNFIVLMSDGELHEGSVWESILFISSRNLTNVKIIIDNNDLQSSTRASDTHPTLYPIEKKFHAFGWDSSLCNGHNNLEIQKKLNLKYKKPFALIAKTIKGYPITFMKNNPKWHYRSPNENEFIKAKKELNYK